MYMYILPWKCQNSVEFWAFSQPVSVFFPVYGFRSKEKTLAEAYQIFKMHFYRKKGFRRRPSWTGKRYFLTRNVNNHCFTCMIRETTKPAIHLRTKAPLWDSNFLAPGRNCLALYSCPRIIIFYIFSLILLLSAARPNVSLTSRRVLLSYVSSLLLSLTTIGYPISVLIYPRKTRCNSTNKPWQRNTVNTSKTLVRREKALG